jgi:hypothetical protein
MNSSSGKFYDLFYISSKNCTLISVKTKIFTHFGTNVKIIYLFPQTCKLQTRLHNNEVLFNIMGAQNLINNIEDSLKRVSQKRGNFNISSMGGLPGLK